MPLINIVERERAREREGEKRERNSALFNQKIDTDISFILYCLREKHFITVQKNHKNFFLRNKLNILIYVRGESNFIKRQTKHSSISTQVELRI